MAILLSEHSLSDRRNAAPQSNSEFLFAMSMFSNFDIFTTSTSGNVLGDRLIENISKKQQPTKIAALGDTT